MGGFKGKSDTVCFEFGKMPLTAVCKFGSRRHQRGGWNKTPGERRRGLWMGDGLVRDISSMVWCTLWGVDYTGTRQFRIPGLYDSKIL